MIELDMAQARKITNRYNRLVTEDYNTFDADTIADARAILAENPDHAAELSETGSTDILIDPAFTRSGEPEILTIKASDVTLRS